MTWSYSTALTALKDKVRFLIGDTDTTNQMLSDEEISGASTWIGSTDPYLVAIQCCAALVSKYSFFVDTTNSALSISASQRSKAYAALGMALKEQRKTVGGFAPTIYVAGALVADNDAVSEDSTYTEPSFSVGMTDNPQATSISEANDTDD